MFTLAACVFLTSCSFAAQSDWELFAPTGGDLRAVEGSPVLPGGVLAGRQRDGSTLEGSLYRSLDGGTSWTEILALSVRDIEFAVDGTAYIGAAEGIWRVSPNLASATQLGLGPGLPWIRDVALDRGDRRAIWIGSERTSPLTETLQFSSDAGQTWQHRTPPERANTTCLAVEVDPTNSSKVFASFDGDGAAGGGVWFSSDRGSTWTERTGSLPSRPIHDIAYSGSRVWIVGGFVGSSPLSPEPFGVYESLDEGLTWNAVHDSSWPTQIIHDIEFDPNDAASIWLATPEGVFRSNDAGHSWSFGVGGTAGQVINEVAVRAQNSNEVLAGTKGFSVWRSVDGGNSFDYTSMPNAPMTYNSVSVHPTDVNQIALTMSAYPTQGVLTSEDGGATWALEPLPPADFSDAVYSAAGELYAIARLYPPTATAVYRRQSGVWSLLGSAPIPLFRGERIQIDPNDPALMMVAGYPGIWRSADGGNNWTEVYTHAFSNGSVVALDSVVTSQGRRWFAGESAWINTFHVGNFVSSVDDGQTWSSMGTGPEHMSSMAQSTYDPSIVYASDAWAYEGGIWASSDYGAQWTPKTLFFLSALDRLVLHPDSDLRVYGVTSSWDYVSDDGGSSFVSNTLHGRGTAKDLEIAPDGSVLYFTSFTGAWRRFLDPVVPYCAAQPNSVGAGALLGWSGSTSISLNDLTIDAVGLPATQPGLLFSGVAQIQFPFGNGIRCVGSGGLGVRRLGTKTSTPFGTVEFDVDLAALHALGIIAPGSSLNFQLQYRDTAAGGALFDFSRALHADFVP